MKFSGKRRKFLTETARTAAGVGVAALMLGIYTRQSRALPADAIRPPGAIDEDSFLGACIRCGLCVRDCPYDTLSLAAAGDDVAPGHTVFHRAEYPLRNVSGYSLHQSLPNWRSRPRLEKIDESRMGLAVVIDQEACIAFQGLRCEVCFNICPVRGKAIVLDYRHNARSGKHALFIPIVHSDACTGCGKCEKACILEQAAIKVMPLSLAKGQMQGHYRLGWDEKEKAGGSLIGTDDKHNTTCPRAVGTTTKVKALSRVTIQANFLFQITRSIPSMAARDGK